jgi:hypothetical protein
MNGETGYVDASHITHYRLSADRAWARETAELEQGGGCIPGLGVLSMRRSEDQPNPRRSTQVRNT